MKRTKISTLLAGIPAFLVAWFTANPVFAGLMPDVEEKLGQASPWQYTLQKAATPTKERMEWFYNDLLTPIIFAVVVFVLALLLWVIIRYNAKANPMPSKTTHNTLLEVIWTLVPVLILVVVVIPSMKILYFVDKTKDAELTLKVTGYQWYWGYEYPDNGGFEFKSNLVPEKDLKEGQPRLLTVDNPVVLPVDTNVRILTAAADVIHSWAVPSFGVKMDAVPGRLNETWVRIEKPGTYYGQCSELCGKDHGFMPIEVKAVSKEEFANWVHTQGGKMPEEIKAEKAAKEAAAKVAAPAEAAKPAADKKEPAKKEANK